jgi:hypothetical protein
MKRSCCEERQKKGHILLAAIVVAERMELKLTPGRTLGLKFTMSLTATVLYSKLKFVKFWLRNMHVVK